MTNEQKPQQWAYSMNGEDDWNLCDSREEAIGYGSERAFENYGESFYIAPAKFAAVDDIVVNIDVGDIAAWNYDELPEDSDWPAATKEQEEDLEAVVTKAVHEWLVRHKLEPDWYMPGKVEELKTADYYVGED